MKQLNWYQIFGKSNIPDGRTVLPTDDIQIWLHCANIWDKTYTTLAEVLADTDTLLALITSNNAVDYMVRSTTWAVAQALVPIMTDNTHPSGVASASSEDSGYDAYKAFDGDSTTMWYSVVALEKNYLNYDFGKKVSVSKSSLTIGSSGSGYRYITYIAGSDDGVTYTDLTSPYTFPTSANGTHEETFTPVSYRYYRAYSYRYGFSTSNGTINELQFYSATITDNSTAMTYIGQNNYCANMLLADATWCNAICNSEYFESVLNVKVPVMTSNTTPSGECFASTQHNIYQAWKAFDGDITTEWDTTQYSYTNQFIGYHFTSAKTILMYKLVNMTASQNIPKNCKVQYSDDNSTWTDVVDSAFVNSNVAGATTSNPLTNSGSHEYWRMFISDTQGGGYYVYVAELQFYGREDV